MMLLSHESFHGANVADVGRMDRLVRALINLDQLPKENSLEALKLLQMAWAHHDVCRSQPPRTRRACAAALAADRSCLDIHGRWPSTSHSGTFGLRACCTR